MKTVFFKAGLSRIQVSGGLADYTDLSISDVPKDSLFVAYELGRSLKNYTKQKPSTLEREFYAINLLTTQEKHLEQLAGRSKQENFLNRYSNVLPYTKNLVPGLRYINASFVTGTRLPEDKELFIATQAPVPFTISDFWQMALSHGGSVFNLCSENDLKKGNCEVYWPELGKSLKYNNIEVTGLAEEQKNGYFIRKFELNDGNTRKNIENFHYTNWPDKGLPGDLKGFEGLLEETKRVESFGKIIVHCSAGVGRTGTFLAARNLKSIIDEQSARRVDFGISVFSVVRRLREQRMHMVQNEEQYKFIHDLVEKWILEKSK